MVKLDRIYTRGGDAGETSLGDGRRVAKHDLRVAAYGTVDEANATLGLARLHTAGEDDAVGTEVSCSTAGAAFGSPALTNSAVRASWSAPGLAMIPELSCAARWSASAFEPTKI